MSSFLAQLFCHPSLFTNSEFSFPSPTQEMVSNFTFANLIPFSVIFSVVSFLLLPLFCSFSPKCHTEHHLQLSGGLQIMKTLVLLLEEHRRQWNIEASIPCECLLESSLLWENGNLSQPFAYRFASPLPHCHRTAPLTHGPREPPFCFWSLWIGLHTQYLSFCEEHISLSMVSSSFIRVEVFNRITFSFKAGE